MNESELDKSKTYIAAFGDQRRNWTDDYRTDYRYHAIHSSNNYCYHRNHIRFYKDILPIHRAHRQ